MFLLSMAAYATLAWQIGFPLYAWRPRWLPVLLGGAAAGWIGLAFIYKLPVLGPALFAGCLAFVPAETWLRLFSWLGLRRELRQETPAEPEPAPEQSEPAAVEAGEPETCITVGHR